MNTKKRLLDALLFVIFISVFLLLINVYVGSEDNSDYVEISDLSARCILRIYWKKLILSKFWQRDMDL